jgi:hypothetical protein
MPTDNGTDILSSLLGGAADSSDPAADTSGGLDLGALLGSDSGGLGGSAGADPNLVGMLQAYSASPFAQGVPSQSGPIGQIAQAIMPFALAHVGAQQERSRQQRVQLRDMLEVAGLMVRVGELRRKGLLDEATYKKTLAEAGLKEREVKLLDQYFGTGTAGVGEGEAAGAAPADPDISKRLPTGASLSVGGLTLRNPADTELGLLAESLGPGATPSAILDEKQRRAEAVARAGSATTLQRQKDLATFRQSLPPKLSSKDLDTIAAGRTLLGLLDDSEATLGTLPKDLTQQQLASSSRNYQLRSQHPLAVTALQSIPGLGNQLDFSSDAALDPYLSWVGQVQSALASFNVQGQRGGIRLIEYLKDHFPNYADSPAEAFRKTRILRTDRAVIQRRINDLIAETRRAGEIAGGLGTSADSGWIKSRIRNTRTGQEADIWMNPTTGETSSQPPAAGAE